jgi:hypothetical protein
VLLVASASLGAGTAMAVAATLCASVVLILLVTRYVLLRRQDRTSAGEPEGMPE